jgi:5-formyltetrahydrofolate cyclo-ligase
VSLPPDELIVRKVKAELRKRMRGLRRAAPLDACRARSRAIVERCLSLQCLGGARLGGAGDDAPAPRQVALFEAIAGRNEVDLSGLDAALRARGDRVYYPSIDPDSNVMTFRLALDRDALAERGFGFDEPPPDAPEATRLDVVLVPALAVDPQGYRLGYGAGYYDRTLPVFAPPATTIIVAFDYQLLVDLPRDSWDVRCEYVVTDTRSMRTVD